MTSMASRRPLLLFGFGERHASLAGRLLLLGYRPQHSDDLRTARAQLAEHPPGVRVVLSPTHFHPPDRARMLAELMEAAQPLGVCVIVTGELPAANVVSAWREDGASLCLWEPFNDSSLRFVVNRALYDSTRGEIRDEFRVPTDLVARVHSGSGDKPALVYNLSIGGAYLETPRPTSLRGRISVSFPLGDAPVTLEARVISTNVTGNLQRPNLPRGMGVRFEAIAPPDMAALAKYVSERGRSFEL